MNRRAVFVIALALAAAGTVIAFGAAIVAAGSAVGR